MSAMVMHSSCGAYEVSVQMEMSRAGMQALIDALTPPKPKGACLETLAKRTRYGGRKARSAWRRLRAQGYIPVHFEIGARVRNALLAKWSCAMKPESLVVRMGMPYAERIAKDRIAGCGEVPCPKCGTPSPCCDHDAVDIGIGIQTGNHEYVCSTHGPFGWGSYGGDVVFQDDDAP